LHWSGIGSHILSGLDGGGVLDNPPCKMGVFPYTNMAKEPHSQLRNGRVKSLPYGDIWTTSRKCETLPVSRLTFDYD
ncbi:MAG: hypothetical protein P8X98_11565, partial [Woeseiaceae bacterium]